MGTNNNFAGAVITVYGKGMRASGVDLDDKGTYTAIKNGKKANIELYVVTQGISPEGDEPLSLYSFSFKDTKAKDSFFGGYIIAATNLLYTDFDRVFMGLKLDEIEIVDGGLGVNGGMITSWRSQVSSECFKATDTDKLVRNMWDNGADNEEVDESLNGLKEFMRLAKELEVGDSLEGNKASKGFFTLPLSATNFLPTMSDARLPDEVSNEKLPDAQVKVAITHGKNLAELCIQVLAASLGDIGGSKIEALKKEQLREKNKLINSFSDKEIGKKITLVTEGAARIVTLTKNLDVIQLAQDLPTIEHFGSMITKDFIEQAIEKSALKNEPALTSYDKDMNASEMGDWLINMTKVVIAALESGKLNPVDNRGDSGVVVIAIALCLYNARSIVQENVNLDVDDDDDDAVPYGDEPEKEDAYLGSFMSGDDDDDDDDDGFLDDVNVDDIFKNGLSD